MQLESLSLALSFIKTAPVDCLHTYLLENDRLDGRNPLKNELLTFKITYVLLNVAVGMLMTLTAYVIAELIVCW